MQPNLSAPYDVLIIGAGLVGNSLAAALASVAKVAILEAHAPTPSPVADTRTLALSFSTQRILTALDMWPLLQPHTTPITQVHVSEAGHFGATRFAAAEYGINALGYTICAHRLSDILQQNVLKNPAIASFYSSTVQQITPIPEGYRVQVETPEGPRVFTTHLLVGADGAQSQTRALLGIAYKEEQYGQTACTAQMCISRAHQNVAYERFAEKTVLAALPLADQQAAIIWTVDTDRAQIIQALSDADFCRQFQAAFGNRLGECTQVANRQAYPVRQVRAWEQIRPHAVLLGNAAHSLHPVAAQGFNLSLRDVAALAQEVMDALKTGQNPGALLVLEKYMQARKKEQAETMHFTQGVLSSFSKKTWPWQWIKEVGLCSMEIFPFTKHMLARRAMGIAGSMPAWVCEKNQEIWL